MNHEMKEFLGESFYNGSVPVSAIPIKPVQVECQDCHLAVDLALLAGIYHGFRSGFALYGTEGTLVLDLDKKKLTIAAKEEGTLYPSDQVEAHYAYRFQAHIISLSLGTIAFLLWPDVSHSFLQEGRIV